MSSVISYSSEIEMPKLAMISRMLVLLGITALMLCVPFLNKCFWAAIIILLVSRSGFSNWKILLRERVFLVALVLVALFTLGVIYSHANWNYALRSWDKYLKILYLFFFLPLFLTKESRRLALYCLISSVMISEVFTYLHYFNLINLGFIPSKHWLFVQDIDAGFIVSFTAYLFINLAIDNKKFRKIFIMGFIICSVDILILNQERTGYLVYLFLAALFFLQRFKGKGVIVAMITIPLLFSTLYLTSDKFSNRTNQVVSDIHGFRHGNQSTSIGLRLAFATYSFQIIRHHWLLGAGTGSFEEIYRSLNGPKINNETWPAHPHNEYISILFQLGLVGLITYLYWIYLQYKASFSLPAQEKRLLQGLIIGFGMLGFCNASLLVNPAGAFYVTFLAIFLAAKYER